MEYIVQGNYGYGWEDLTASAIKKEAKEDLDVYRTEEPQYTHRMISRREK